MIGTHLMMCELCRRTLFVDVCVCVMCGDPKNYPPPLAARHMIRATLPRAYGTDTICHSVCGPCYTYAEMWLKTVRVPAAIVAHAAVR